MTAALVAPIRISVAYAEAAKQNGPGACPIEAGLVARLADCECRHGRLAGDRTPACGCWGPA